MPISRYKYQERLDAGDRAYACELYRRRSLSDMTNDLCWLSQAEALNGLQPKIYNIVKIRKAIASLTSSVK
jgi:hypothetical protein